MKWINNILREIFGLVVDDGAFALAIIIWIALMCWATFHFSISSGSTGIFLFAGLALILIESTTRYSKRRKLRR